MTLLWLACAFFGVIAAGISLVVIASFLGTGWFANVIIFLAMAWLFTSLLFKKQMKALGERKPSRVTIDSNELVIGRGGQNLRIRRPAIRRLRYHNTASGHSAAFADNAALGNLRAASEQKWQAISWSVLVDYDNETAVIADGLDEVTSENIGADLNNDLFNS